MLYSVTIELPFEAAHRLIGHSGKCKNLHGHSYRAVIVVEAIGLDNLGMVVDFGDIKSTIGAWIDNNWDHNILLQTSDPLYNLYFEQGDISPKITQQQITRSDEIFQSKEPYDFSKPPTAEVIATELMEVATMLLKKKTKLGQIASITIHETARCCATVKEDHK